MGFKQKKPLKVVRWWLSMYIFLNLLIFYDIITLDFFPTCQVRVVRFYVSCLVLLLLLSSPPPLVVLLLSLSSSSSCSTATRDPQCSLSDLNHDHPRPVFPAGPQPRPSTPSVPCRTSCRKIKCQIECQKICQVECQKICQKICQIDMPEDIPEDMPDRMPENMSEYTPEDMPDRMP